MLNINAGGLRLDPIIATACDAPPMEFTQIAEQAEIARNALEQIAKATAGLPRPKLKFARSIQLLARLAEWARSRSPSAFSDAQVLPRALRAALKEGLDEIKLAALLQSKAGATDAAIRLGCLGGASRSESKVAAARKNISALNKKRWGSKRRKQKKA